MNITRKVFTTLWAGLLLGAAANAPLGAVPEAARPADALIETIGIGDRFDWRHNDGILGNAEAALGRLKIRYLRAGMLGENSNTTAYITDMKAMAARLNARVCVNVWWNSPATMTDAFNQWTTGTNSHVVDAIEGVNESFGQPAGTMGEYNWGSVLQVQEFLWNLARPKGYNVYMWTRGGPAGIYFLDHDLRGAQVTDQWTTHANFHPYHWYAHPDGCFRTTKMNSIHQDCDTPGRVGGIGAVRYMLENPNKPFVVTEWGWDTNEPFAVPEAVRVKYYTRGILENFNSGMTRGYLFSLSADAGENFGISNRDGTLRPSGQAIADLIALLQEPGKASIATTSLDYTLATDSGMSTVDDRDIRNDEIHRTLLQKSDGTHYLTLWVDSDSHEGETGTQAASLTLANGASQVRIYKPVTNGTTAVATLGPVAPGGRVRLEGATAIPDHPLIVEIRPAVGTPPGGTEVTVDDPDPAVTYSGGWQLGPTPGRHNDTNHETSADGASARFSFTGTGIALIGEKQPWGGTAEVLIDGVSQGSISFAAGAQTLQQVVFSRSGLSAGSHTLTLTKTGGPWMYLDALRYTPAPFLPPVTLAAVADASVRDGAYANTNYGTAAELITKQSSGGYNHTNYAASTERIAKQSFGGYNRWSYLRFDLSGVTGTVPSAKLRVWGRLGAAGSFATGVYPVASTSWAETGITWSNKPAVGATALGSVTVNATTGRWYELDVTAYVQAERAAGRNVISLALRNLATSDSVTYWNSRENTSNKPELVIVRP